MSVCQEDGDGESQIHSHTHKHVQSEMINWLRRSQVLTSHLHRL